MQETEWQQDEQLALCRGDGGGGDGSGGRGDSEGVGGGDSIFDYTSLHSVGITT